MPGSPRPATKRVRGVTFERAKAVLDRNQRLIRTRYRGVVGTGIGAVPGASRARDGENLFGIMVLVKTSADVPRTRQSIEGVPLIFMVTGEFTALSAP
jgi:hypothetical protein